tara:strand:+ start:694 stop:867 length:174 start_codon:yes stop_codon:yes gene_type:complete
MREKADMNERQQIVQLSGTTHLQRMAETLGIETWRRLVPHEHGGQTMEISRLKERAT